METIIHPLDCDIEPPARFTWPFCYEPHPLCLAAAAEVQRYIASIAEWQEEIGHGKMFGVLVVRQADGRTAFLAAYSGLLCGRNDLPWFVPSVFDSQQPDGYFKTHEAVISAINRRIEELEASKDRQALDYELEAMRRQADNDIALYKEKMAEAKRRRDLLRGQGADDGPLTDESRFMKAELRRMRQMYARRMEQTESFLKVMDENIELMRRQRHRFSDDLQRWLFSQYVVLNAQGGRRTLTDIFAEATGRIPPAGAGDCCAPKLLQYAYRNGLHPLCMGEFWWGEPPRTELRRHLNYYPACRGKCKPILEYMMKGLDVDPDPLAGESDGKELEIVYEDGLVAVVLKPEGMLTVPGKSRRGSVLSEMRKRCPEAEGPMIVHRLDMATSGLLVVAKTVAAYHNLQVQFRERTVCKTYTALLEGRPTLPTRGRISLPLRPDPLDRPRQTVDYDNGKEAVTEYRMVSTTGNRTLIELHPLTGRTHQLRVHCAHPDGLNMPIAGDTLYGRPADRLYLHARRIEFAHPATGRRMAFERKAGWEEQQS